MKRAIDGSPLEARRDACVPDGSGIVMANGVGEWLLAGATVLSIAWFMMEYHRLWRFKGYSLGMVNECFAIGGTCGIALALLLGRWDRESLLRLRRPLGVVGVLAAAMHSGISLLKFQKYAWETKHIVSLCLGVLAMAGLGFMAVTSYPWAVRRLGVVRWRRLQRWGYVFLLAALVHFVVLGKIPAWLNWFRTFDKPAPPGTLIPFTLGVAAILAKLIGSTMRRRSTEAPNSQN